MKPSISSSSPSSSSSDESSRCLACFTGLLSASVAQQSLHCTPRSGGRVSASRRRWSQSLHCTPRSGGRVSASRRRWSLLGHFRTERRCCSACGGKWRLADTGLCPCGESRTVSHTVGSWPLAKLSGSLSRLCSVDGDTVSWLKSCDS